MKTFKEHFFLNTFYRHCTVMISGPLSFILQSLLRVLTPILEEAEYVESPGKEYIGLEHFGSGIIRISHK